MQYLINQTIQDIAQQDTINNKTHKMHEFKANMSVREVCSANRF